MKQPRFTITDLIVDARDCTKLFQPSPCASKYCAASEIVMVEDGFPMLHFEWSRIRTLVVNTQKGAQALEGAGYAVIENLDGEASVRAMRTEKKHFWLCNFRRYGWFWSTHPRGDEGVGFGIGGVNYNEGHSLKGLVTTPEEMVKFTALVVWGRLGGAKVVPDVFFAPVSQLMFAELVEDAVKNVSPLFADPRKSAGTRHRDSITYGRRYADKKPILCVSKIPEDQTPLRR